MGLNTKEIKKILKGKKMVNSGRMLNQRGFGGLGTTLVMLLVLAGVLVFWPSSASAADRYWVGGTDSWDATAGTKWALTSGGAGGQAVPTSADNVYFDANSGAVTVTVAAIANTADLQFTGYTGTFAGSSALNIYGSLTMAAGMTRTSTGPITFRATSAGKTITFAGKTLASAITFDGVGGVWTLQDAWNSGYNNVTLTKGSFDTNGQSFWCGIFSSNNSNIRTLTLGNSELSVLYWNISTVTNLTFNANTSTIIHHQSSNLFAGGGLTYYNVEFTLGANNTLSGANTFNNLTITGSNSATQYGFKLADNQTVNGTFTVTGYNANKLRTLITSNTVGTSRTITAAVVSVSNADFQDITGAGAGSWNLSGITGGSGNCEGNSGITFTTPQTNYWVGGTGSWSAVAEWASSSGGGAGTGRVPLPQDDARFDANSFSGAGLTVTQDMPRAGKNINWTGVLNSPTVALSVNTSIYGSLTLVAGMTFSENYMIYFYGRGSHTITTGGVTLSTSDVYIYAFGGTYTLQDSLTHASTKSFWVENGTFDANDNNVTTGIFRSSNSNIRTILMGSGTWTLQYTGWVWVFSTVTNLTLNTETSTIKITDTSATDKTFSGGSKTYYNLWFTGAGTGNFILIGSNTFNDFKVDTPPHTVQFTAGTITTVTTFTVSGTAGNLITIGSITSAIHTLSKASGIVESDYLSIASSTATGGATWYAGANSVNGGNNSGWIFTAANATPIAPTSLQGEGQTNPLTVTDETPEFSAIYNDPDAGDTANYYQIQADDDSGFGSTIWDSAKTSMSNCTQGDRCQDISYGGPTPLARQVQWFWRIKFWDIGEAEGAWSTEEAYFYMFSPRSSGGVNPSGGGFLSF